MESVAKQIRNTFYGVNRLIAKKVHHSTIQEVTMMHSWILLYIADKENQCIQKDLEKEFNLKKSSMSTTLALMEDKGYIQRCIDSKDSRRKIIHITDYGRFIVNEMQHTINETFELVQSFISGDEAYQLNQILTKIEKQCEKEVYDD